MPRFSKEGLEKIAQMDKVRSALSKRGPSLIKGFCYALPRLLYIPIYKGFSYFKSMETLKNLANSEEEKEIYQQAQGLLSKLRKIIQEFVTAQDSKKRKCFDYCSLNSLQLPF